MVSSLLFVASSRRAAEIESEEVRITISGGKMAGIDEAGDIENLKRPFLELDNLPFLSPSRCIYKVPERLRRKNEEAYTPQVVSIGPLHHGKENLRAMEEHKKRYLRDFLNRTREGVNFPHYIQGIKEEEHRLRDFYAESIACGSDEFATIVLVDAAFVIEFLLRYHDIYHEDDNSQGKDDYSQDKDDYIFNNPVMLGDVLPDLLLLENQLPFFILQELFNTLSSPQRHSLLEISYFFFKTQIDSNGKKDKFKNICSPGENEQEVKHFVDLMRILILCQHSASKIEKKYNSTAVPNVTELLQAGAKIEEGTGSSLLDIEFSGGILKIPKLRVDDTTYLKLRNLLAFEQCHHGEEDYIANYVFLMKRLVKTPEDVQLLVEKGIIDNWLADTQKVCTLLWDLGTGMMVADRYYASLCNDLTKFRKKRWRRWMVILKQQYFNNPWSSLSVAAAVILLVLTVITAACAYKSTPLL